MAANSTPVVIKKEMTFEEAWSFLQEEGINKILNHIEGIQAHRFTSEEYMRLYTTVYNVCQPNPNGPEVQRMYDQYKRTFEDYISSKVLPSLRGKKNEDLLQELLIRWKNHKTMTYWLSRFFHYLNRYFLVIKRLPLLVETSHLAFYNLVYREMNDQVRDAIVSLINRERDGKQIDETLVKGAVDIYVDMAEGSQKYYEKDFEEALINATTTFYSERALEWITSDSYEDYMLKAEEYINKEKSSISNYLKFGSKSRVLEIAEHELLVVHASALEGKKQLNEVVA